MRRVNRTETTSPITRRRSARRASVGVAAAGAVAAALVAGTFAWSAPREEVAVPGPDATPEQVVRAYIEAVNARDFDTANVIDARPGQDLDRFSRPMQTHAVEMGRTVTRGATAHVLFSAGFAGGDGTVEDGPWGYYLERGDDELWHITDAGVG